MSQKLLASLLLILFSCSCAAPVKTPITWKQDEDEIVFYLYLSKDASKQLIELLSEPVHFEQVSEFLVENTDVRMPFTEGILTTAALVTHQEEVKETLDKNTSPDEHAIQIIGFKENPVRIVRETLKDLQVPKYLSDFDPQKHPQVIDALLNMLDGNSFVLEVY